MNLITDDMLLEFYNNRGRATYERLSSAFAIYPGIGTMQGLAYVSLKLTGECAELQTASNPNDIVKEAGDVLWYLGALNRELGLEVRDIARMDADCSTIGSDWYTIYHTIPDPLLAAATLGEMVGKAMRDDGEVTTARLDSIQEQSLLIWVALCDTLTFHKCPMSECMLTNLEKLRDRSMRGTLGGSGDNR